MQGFTKMVKSASLALALCISLATFTATHGLTLSFGESDRSVTENNPRVTVSVTKAGRSRGNVTCTLIPLSLEQAFQQYGYQTTGAPDPAEAGLDFSPALVEHVFQPGTDTVDEWLSIELMDDEILEMEEVFLVRLNVSLTDPQDEAELDVERQWLLIRIRPDKDVSILKGTQLSGAVSEAAGVVEGFITIVRVGESEVPISFRLAVDAGTVSAVKGVDFDLETGQYTLHAAQDNLTFSLHVIDDVVAEGTQSFIWTLSQAQTEYFSVDIIDNDPVTVKLANSTVMTVEEGDSVTLCAEIHSPPDVEMDIFIQGELLPGTAEASTDYSPTPVFYFLNRHTRSSCLEISTLDDSVPEPVEEFSLTLTALDTGLTDGLINLQPESITFVVEDNDIPRVQVELSGNSSFSEGVTLTEGEGRVDNYIRIFVPEPHSIAVQFSVSVSSGSAQSGEDFEVETGIFTLAPGNSSVFLPVSVLEDDYVEYDEQWTVTISQQDASFPPLTIPFTISDNDYVIVGFANDSVLRVGEGAVVRVCGKIVDVAPSLLQREIVLEGRTVPGTAEEGSDYEALSWNFTFSSSSTGLTCVAVATIDDTVPEVTESFSVSIELVAPTPFISVRPPTLTVHIVSDDIPQLEVEVVGSPSDLSATLNEGDGTLDKLIRVFSPGVHPFPLDYTVSVTPSTSDDFTTKVGSFRFTPEQEEHFLSVTILEDEVAEADEPLVLTIMLPGLPPRVVSLVIRDNDELTVGFTDRSAVSVEEGKVVTICANLTSPEAVDRSALLQARTVPLTAKAGEDYKTELVGWRLNATHRTACFDIQTLDNKKPQHLREFRVRLEVRGQAAPFLLRLDPDIVAVKILDNDGTPLAPVISDVKLHRDSTGGKYNLSFSWVPQLEELRPIDSYSGTVTLSHPVEKEEDDEKSGSSKRRSRRQEDDDVASQIFYSLFVDGSVSEYTVVDIQPAEEYTVQVCSRNKLGFNCSVPETYSKIPPTVSSEADRAGDDGGGVALSVGVIVGIVTLVLLASCICCLFFFFLLLFLCYASDDWRSYQPEKKEKKCEKDFARYRDMHAEEEEDEESDWDSDLGDEV